MLNKLFQTINRINPTSHGRNFVTNLALRLDAIPKDGVYCLEAGLKMELHMNDFIERSLYFYSFEFMTKKIICEFFHKNFVFVDIGANVGYYSLLAHARTKDARIIAFEPNPETVKKLRKNITLSSANSIEVFDFGLSDTEEVVNLYCPKNETHGHASLMNQGWSDTLEYRISTKLLDEIIPADISRIDLIKIDTEGAELYVFQGAKETIMKFKPAIIMELNKKAAINFGYDTLDAVKVLMTYNPNYRLKLIMTHKAKDIAQEELFRKGIREGNLLFY